MSAARIVFAIIAVLVALFCVFGFMASFEGSDAKFWAFRIGYAVIGVAAVVAAIVSLTRRS
jgi:Na+/melibiose symporter-like transporter